MQFNTVLFHTRFREMAFNSLEAVAALNASGLKKVVLTYVIDREEVAFVPYGGYLKKEEARIRETAETRFEEWRKMLATHGIESTFRIEVGDDNASILDVAETEKADLIVAGRKDRGLFEKIYVGRHILDLLRRSSVPALMGKYRVNYDSDGTELVKINDAIFTRPMLATDWSHPSQNAIEALKALSGVAEACVICHVIDEKLTKGIDEPAFEAIRQESRSRLDTVQQQLTGAPFNVSTCLAVGQTVPEILRTSREQEASMIVMGRTGKDWFEEYWLGGVTHRVAELSELPVMVVP